MIACTSPAGTLSDTPLRIGLLATVAWRFSILSICLPLPLNRSGLRLNILYPSAKLPDQLIKLQRTASTLDCRSDLLQNDPIGSVARLIGTFLEFRPLDLGIDRVGEFE